MPRDIIVKIYYVIKVEKKFPNFVENLLVFFKVLQAFWLFFSRSDVYEKINIFYYCCKKKYKKDLVDFKYVFYKKKRYIKNNKITKFFAMS